MSFTSVRLITADILPLIQFYERITGITAIKYTEDFAEIRTELATLAIGSTRTLTFFGGDAIATPAQNSSAILEFRVENVDTKFEEHSEFLGSLIVQPPTTMPWGNRSLLFRDPDGNLINFFSPITTEAKEKFGI
jgi:catechol 2,3-dioxygenase-like lactoylglutathione lyase family enzyme